jgi:hypothetical protein
VCSSDLPKTPKPRGLKLIGGFKIKLLICSLWVSFI